jgi:hypothetical protein
MTGNELVSQQDRAGGSSFLVAKGKFVPPAPAATAPAARLGPVRSSTPVQVPERLPTPAPAPAVAPLSVMGVGSWPRPRWLLEALHAHLEGKLGDAEFEQTADDAVKLSVAAQVAAGVDVVTDGEQRRDNYASFVGARLDNCQLVPITDLLSYVSDPAEFERELAGDQSHAYQIALAAGQYLHVVAEQRGIDVVVTLFGPDGKKLDVPGTWGADLARARRYAEREEWKDALSVLHNLRKRGRVNDIEEAHKTFVQWRAIRADTIRLLYEGKTDAPMQRTRPTGAGGDHVREQADVAPAQAERTEAQAERRAPER